jgi:hypothetical protein
MTRLRRIPARLGHHLGVFWGLLVSFGTASDQQVLRVPAHAAREFALLALRCFPSGLILGLVIGRFIDRFGPELQAPDQLTEIALAPIALLVAGMIYVLMRGITVAEQYSVNIEEGGYCFIRDCGGNLATDIIAPRILAASLGVGLLATAVAAMTYVGASPSAAIGISSHPAMTGEAFAVLLRAGAYGTGFGSFAAFAAFLVGLESRRPPPGQVARRMLASTLPVLLAVVLVILWD